jgi:hypothetical protein
VAQAAAAMAHLIQLLVVRLEMPIQVAVVAVGLQGQVERALVAQAVAVLSSSNTQ